jgi:hypothetical protein
MDYAGAALIFLSGFLTMTGITHAARRRPLWAFEAFFWAATYLAFAFWLHRRH